jgi:hypothetical protein
VTRKKVTIEEFLTPSDVVLPLLVACIEVPTTSLLLSTVLWLLLREVPISDVVRRWGGQRVLRLLYRVVFPDAAFVGLTTGWAGVILVRDVCGAF